MDRYHRTVRSALLVGKLSHMRHGELAEREKLEILTRETTALFIPVSTLHSKLL